MKLTPSLRDELIEYVLSAMHEGGYVIIEKLLAAKNLAYLEQHDFRSPTVAGQLIEFMENEDLIISEPETFGAYTNHRISHWSL